MKKEVLTDAIVTFADALKWAEPLMKQSPDDVIKRALAIKPAVFGVAANIAKRTAQRIEAGKLQAGRGEYVFDRICLASAIVIELMKKGNALLFDDLIDDPERKEEGKHE